MGRRFKRGEDSGQVFRDLGGTEGRRKKKKVCVLDALELGAQRAIFFFGHFWNRAGIFVTLNLTLTLTLTSTLNLNLKP